MANASFPQPSAPRGLRPNMGRVGSRGRLVSFSGCTSNPRRSRASSILPRSARALRIAPVRHEQAILPFISFPKLTYLRSGENKAALDLARREGRVLGFCKYEIYNIDEDNVWEEIDALEGWWKESTWSRLIQRELPDL